MLKSSVLFLLAGAIVALTSPSARGDLIVYGSHSDHHVVPGADLADVSMAVELTAEDGVATVTFTNTSLAWAVLKEIVIDTCDGDTGQAVLWDPIVLTDTPEVAYRLADSNGLPGYHSVTVEPCPLVEFQALPPPPKRGIGTGESLVVQFATSLPNGSTVDDYLAWFNGGQDTLAYSVGFHAIDADVVNGQSLSGIYVPEPGTLIVLATGSLMVLRRRRRTA